MPRALVTCVIGFSCLFAEPAPAFDRQVWTSFPNMNYVTALAEGANVVFVGTTGGIRRYDRMAGRWLAPLTTLDGLPENRVERMAFDPDTGDLWFDTPSGAGRWISNLQVVFRGGSFPRHLRHPRPNQEIPSIIPPFGYFVDPHRIIGPRREYAITDILIDSWRHLWIATWGLGIGHSDLSDRRLRFLPFGPMDDYITAIAKDGDALWLGGEDPYQPHRGGITRFFPHSGTWEYFSSQTTAGLDNAQISAILPDQDRVFFGTQRGLVRYEKKEDRWLTYRDTRFWGQIQALASDGDILWIGSERGLGLLDIKRDSLDIVAGSDHAVIRCLITGPDYVWAGTETGLFQCRRGSRTWRPVADPKGFSRRPVRAFSQHKNSLWIATEMPAALLRHTPSEGTWEEFPMTEIGGSLRVSVAADSAQAWIGTDIGAFSLDVSRQIWTQYTPANGLIHPRVQAVLFDDGYIWFGTASGLSRYQRNRFPQN